MRSVTHRDVGLSLTYLPSSKRVLGGFAGSLSIFDMNTDRLKGLPRRVAGRELNGGEQLCFSASLTAQRAMDFESGI